MLGEIADETISAEQKSESFYNRGLPAIAGTDEDRVVREMNCASFDSTEILYCETTDFDVLTCSRNDTPDAAVTNLHLFRTIEQVIHDLVTVCATGPPQQQDGSWS